MVGCVGDDIMGCVSDDIVGCVSDDIAGCVCDGVDCHGNGSICCDGCVSDSWVSVGCVSDGHVFDGCVGDGICGVRGDALWSVLATFLLFLSLSCLLGVPVWLAAERSSSSMLKKLLFPLLFDWFLTETFAVLLLVSFTAATVS